MSVDTDPATYSSEGSIVATDPEEEFPLPMFIAMDRQNMINSEKK